MAASEPVQRRVVLVLGECGNGKSTLVSSFRDKRLSDAPPVGLNPTGVTKEVLVYPGDIDGVPYDFIDTPGIGDSDVTPVQLFTMLEALLESGTIPGGIFAVLVTTPIPARRIKLGDKIVKLLVDLGFIAPEGENSYGRVFLVGTKADRADEDDKQAFLRGIDGHRSVKECFFPGAGTCVMTHKDDYSEAREALAQLPPGAIEYKKPAASEVAESLALILGLPAEELLTNMVMMRDQVDKHKQQIRDLFSEQLKVREEVLQSFKEVEVHAARTKEELNAIHATQERALARFKERMERLRTRISEGPSDGSPEQNLKRALCDVHESLKLGMDELQESGRALGEGSQETQLSRVQQRVRSAAAHFKNADQNAEGWCDSAKNAMQRAVSKRTYIEERQEELRLQAEQCSLVIKAKQNRTDDCSKEIDDLRAQLGQMQREASHARDQANAERKKRDAMNIGGGIACAIPVFGWIAGGSAIAIANTAVRKAEHCAMVKEQIANMNACSLQQRLAWEEQVLEMEKEQFKEAQKQLNRVADETGKAKELEAQITAQIGRMQTGVEGTSKLWTVAKDVFSRADAANVIAEGPGFRLSLLKGPLLAIAQCEGFETLKDHALLNAPAGSPCLLESIPELLERNCPGATIDIGNFI